MSRARCQTLLVERCRRGWGVTRGEGAPDEPYRDDAARRGVRADAAARRRGRAVRPRRHAAVQGRHLRRHRGHPADRSLPARAPAGPRGDPRPVRARRAGRPDHRLQRAHPARRAGPHRRRPLPAHAHRLGADRGQRRLLRADRPRARHPPAAGGGGHPDRAVRLRGRRRRRRSRRPRPGRGVRGHRPAHRRGLPPAVGDHARRPRGDRGDRRARRRHQRRPDRLRRPGLPHQRPAPRPDDRRRGPARRRQGAGPRHPAADAGRLDDHGRGPGRRLPDRRGRQADAGGGGDRGAARPPLLRGRVLRRLGDHRRREPPVADLDSPGRVGAAAASSRRARSRARCRGTRSP